MALRDRPADDEVKAAFIEALSDFDPGVRGRAAQALDRHHWRPETPKEELWHAIARGQLSHAATFGVDAIEPLEMVLHGSPYNLQVSAIRALGEIPDDRVLNSLLPALRASDHAVVVAAIDALGQFGGPKATDALTAILKHPDHRVRVACVEAVGKLENPQATKSILELLKDVMWDVRRAAANALGRLPDPQAVEGLLTAVKDVDADVREAAIASLRRIASPRAVSALVLALVDPESNVRHAAASALQQTNPKWAQSEAAQQVIPELRAAANASDQAVRYAATSVLQQLGAAPATQAGLESPNVLTTAGQKQRKAAAIFIDLLRDIDREVRLAAAQSLGRLGDQRAASALMSALSDRDEAVRRAAAESLEFLHYLGAA